MQRRGKTLLSHNFHAYEFMCRCCRKLLLWPELVEALQDLRTTLGAPIRINSGYRCPRHNRGVGGSPTSQHLLGKAADIVVPGHNVADVYELVHEKAPFTKGGVGLYPDEGFVHVDIRGKKARWGRVNGIMVPIEEAYDYAQTNDTTPDSPTVFVHPSQS